MFVMSYLVMYHCFVIQALHNSLRSALQSSIWSCVLLDHIVQEVGMASLGAPDDYIQQLATVSGNTSWYAYQSFPFYFSCTGSQLSLVYASKMVRWRLMELVCSLHLESSSIVCLINLMWNHLIHPQLVFKSIQLLKCSLFISWLKVFRMPRRS